MKNLSIFEPQIEKHYAYKKNMYLDPRLLDTVNSHFSTLILGVLYDDPYNHVKHKKKFAGINFQEAPKLKYFAGIGSRKWSN